MSKPKRIYIFSFKYGPRHHFYDPDSAADVLTELLGGDEDFYKGLVKFFDDMEIGDTQHLETMTIECVEDK